MEDDPRRYHCCRRCREEWEDDNADLGPIALLARRMSVCPECGSKRCQKAEDHAVTCSPVKTTPTVAEMAGLFEGGPDSVEWLRKQRDT